MNGDGKARSSPRRVWAAAPSVNPFNGVNEHAPTELQRVHPVLAPWSSRSFHTELIRSQRSAPRSGGGDACERRRARRKSSPSVEGQGSAVHQGPDLRRRLTLVRARLVLRLRPPGFLGGSSWERAAQLIGWPESGTEESLAVERFSVPVCILSLLKWQPGNCRRRVRFPPRILQRAFEMRVMDLRGSRRPPRTRARDAPNELRRSLDRRP